jgi:phosphatidate cytidylyltransferase
LPLAMMLGWVGVVELLEMFNKRGRMPIPWVVYAGVQICIVLSGLAVFWPSAVTAQLPGSLGWLTIGLAAGLLLAFIGEVVRYDGRWQSTVNLGLESLIILYLGGGLGFIAQLRQLSEYSNADDGRLGMLALISLIAIVKMSDTGQYTAGRLFGRHKLAPQVSPGKTWEGAVGGAVFAIIAAWIVFGWAAQYFVQSPKPFAEFFSDYGRVGRVSLYAIALCAAGIIGDLAESVLKRDAGVKDSSAWMPGFGGVLDLLDSLLGAAPVAYLLWATGFVWA